MPKKGSKLQISLQIKPDLWARFKLLVNETGSSLNYAVERVITATVNEGRIPGLDPLHEHETREQQKYGQATPVYDGEAEQAPRPVGRKTPTPPSA